MTGHFDYHRIMVAKQKRRTARERGSAALRRANRTHPGADEQAASIAAAIGEPARARMLFTLMDGRARTHTELAAIAEVAPSTASAHLRRLKEAQLVKVVPQGRHRYFGIEGADVAAALEALSVVAGRARTPFTPTTPTHLHAARTCYDHIAGRLGVALHDRFAALGWLESPRRPRAARSAYDLTADGVAGFQALGIDLDTTRARRRRFAFACVDWSERRPHLGGALAADLLRAALARKWVERDLDSRVLTITPAGRRELSRRLGLEQV